MTPDLPLRIANVLMDAKRKAIIEARPMYAADVAAVIREAFPKLQEGGAAARKKGKTPINKMTDDEFMGFLHAEPPLSGIDIPRHIGICQTHFKAKGINPSRMRILNWLLRVDKTLERHGRTAEVRAADVAERQVAPPTGWRDFMKKKQQQWALDGGDASEAPGTYALSKGDFFGMPKSWRDECRRAAE